ncbi:MAG: hypothetical protein ABDH28_04645 [Brevinematia bacterium]
MNPSQLMEDKSQNQRIYHLFVIKTLISSAIDGWVFLRLFLGQVSLTSIYFTLGIAVLTLPLLKFLLMMTLWNKLSKTYVTISFPIFNIISNFLLIGIYSAIILLLNIEFAERIDRVLVFLLIVLLFETSISSGMIPFLLDFSKKRESISKQILISSSLISAILIALITLMGTIPFFSWVDQAIASVVIITTLVISLIKAYRISI